MRHSIATSTLATALLGTALVIGAGTASAATAPAGKFTATAKVSSIDEAHRLSVKFGETDLGLTLSTEQLLTLSEVIEWYLFKRDDPAATLEEILEGLG